MTKASEELIKEHNAVLIALDILDKINHQIQQGSAADLRDIEDMLEFLKIFVDKCHHGKEEGILFPAMVQLGMQRHNGPIAVMLSEHQQGREYIQQMQESIKDGTVNNDTFIEATTSYIILLRNHIAKENNILFPISDEMLSESMQVNILNDFEDIEENVVGEGKHEEFHQMLHKLKAKYNL
jgi:hemerythrin-like domain-containing protein